MCILIGRLSAIVKEQNEKTLNWYISALSIPYWSSKGFHSFLALTYRKKLLYKVIQEYLGSCFYNGSRALMGFLYLALVVLRGYESRINASGLDSVLLIDSKLEVEGLMASWADGTSRIAVTCPKVVNKYSTWICHILKSPLPLNLLGFKLGWFSSVP